MKLQTLIIEDESIVALHIKRTVISLGHNVVEIVKNSEDALLTAASHKVDLVISDINIDGDVDGIECCSILQNMYNTSVIFITAHKDITTLEKASKIDFVGYIVKPFREDELETMIKFAELKFEKYNKNQRYIIDERYSYCYKTNQLFSENELIELTKKEKIFLQVMLQVKDSIVTYATLENHLWSDEAVCESARRQLVHRFKQKVPNFPLTLIKGEGYKLER